MTISPNKRPKAASSASQRPQSSRGGSSARRYSKEEITRNRIIAIIVIIVLVALLVGLVTCVANNIIVLGGDKSDTAQLATSSRAVDAETESTQAIDAGGESEQAAELSVESEQVAEPDGETGQAAESDSETDQTPKPVTIAGEKASALLAQVVSAAKGVIGVEDPWVEGGLFKTGDAELDRMIKDFCDAHSSPDLSLEENAFNAYCSAAWYEFKERDNNQHPTGPLWDVEYAKQAIIEDSANCFEQVAFTEYVLKYFGYTEAYAEPCLILRQSGEYGDHGLLYVTNKDGRKCLCDPAFGANGWMLDADIYTVKLMDVGQDPFEFTIAPFEEVVRAPWIEG